MDIGEVLNVPFDEFEHQGKTYRPKKLDVEGLALLSQFFKNRAKQECFRDADLPEDARPLMLRAVAEGIAAGEYDPGGPVFLRGVATPHGASYALYLALRDDHPELTESDVRDIFFARLEELAGKALAAVGDGGKA